MCKLSGGLSSLHKLVMVLAIEATGRVALEAAVPAGRQVQESSGKKLVYFGQHHLDTERQHTVEDQTVHQSLADLNLLPATVADLRGIVDRVFEHFSAFIDEAYQMTRTGRVALGGEATGAANGLRALCPESEIRWRISGASTQSRIQGDHPRGGGAAPKSNRPARVFRETSSHLRRPASGGW